jgi:HEAT repeat protein
VRVRTALRHIALDPTAEGSLRATALRALGRAGSAEDARTFLGLLKTRSVPREVLNGAVIGLGCLPPAATDEALRGRVAALFDDVVAGRLALPGSTRLLAIMALSLHARDNRALSRSLALRCARDCSSANEAAALLYACGLSRDPLLTLPIFEAARSGTLGGKKLHDVARSHATLALAMTGDPGAVPALGQVLRSRRAPVQTRRSAALAIGLLLRSESVIGKHRDQACDALLRSLRKDRDPMVRAYCIVGMGTAHEPEFGVDALLERVDRSGDPVVRPFAAIALGLAAKRLPEAKAKESRRLLLREMQKTRDIECSAALAIAAGLSGAVAAREELIERLSHERLNAAIRGPAIQGLGLLGRTSPEIERKLLATLEDGSDVVVEDSALALGLLGGRSAARTLVVKLATTRSEPVQAHMVVALSHLGGATAIEPLLELLEDRSKKHTMRESAAAALGVLVDDRERDPLFEIDAHTNPFALTAASRELVRVY